MKTVGTFAYLARCEQVFRQQYQREWHRSPLDIDGLSCMVFTTGTPMVQVRITLRGDKNATIKIEEQHRLGTFVVGAAADDGATIFQNRDKLLRLDDPLSKLIEAFPDNPRVKKFVECLLNSK